MGWYSGNRREEVKQHLGPWDAVEGVVCKAIKHRAAGNEDWFVMEARSHDGKLVDTWISLMIWENGMYKPMDEAVGPCYYRCPVEWLDSVPVPDSPYAAGWREKVRAIAPAAHDCDKSAVPYKSKGALGHGWECGVCHKFLQAG
jgi:hypothetical protein